MDFFSFNTWQIWLLLACIIAVLELLMLNSYYLLAVVVGAMLAGGMAWFDSSSQLQWLAFIAGTIAAAGLMYTLRSPRNKENKDDISHMIGKRVKVIEEISPRGRVVYKSVGWSAESDDVLHTGAYARIVRIHGSTLFVEKIEEK